MTLPAMAFPGTVPAPAGGLSAILGTHCAAADVACAALLEESGVMFACAGDGLLSDHGETAALATAAFHATREVARRLGESAFEGLCHEGRDRHFYISPVAGPFLLLSIFGNQTKLAIVRASAARTAEALRQALPAATVLRADEPALPDAP